MYRQTHYQTQQAIRKAVFILLLIFILGIICNEACKWATATDAPAAPAEKPTKCFKVGFYCHIPPLFYFYTILHNSTFWGDYMPKHAKTCQQKHTDKSTKFGNYITNYYKLLQKNAPPLRLYRNISEHTRTKRPTLLVGRFVFGTYRN